MPKASALHAISSLYPRWRSRCAARRRTSITRLGEASPACGPCPPYGWAAASSFARASRNGSGPMNRPPDQCYDPITPVFIAKTHGKDKRASTATSERQFAGKTTREAQNVGFALSRRRHQEVRNAGAAFQDEQEPGRGEAGRAFKRSERPQRGNA